MDSEKQKDNLRLLAANRDLVELACQRQRLMNQFFDAPKHKKAYILQQVEEIERVIEGAEVK